LLHPATPSKSISVREDAHGDIILAGVKEEVVTSFENMIRSLLSYSSSFALSD
jgi:kinesin family protein 4/21/27